MIIRRFVAFFYVFAREVREACNIACMVKGKVPRQPPWLTITEYFCILVLQLALQLITMMPGDHN